MRVTHIGDPGVLAMLTKDDWPTEQQQILELLPKALDDGLTEQQILELLPKAFFLIEERRRESAEAERDRYRAALEELRGACWWLCRGEGRCDGSVSRSRWCPACIASEALASTKEG